MDKIPDSDETFKDVLTGLGVTCVLGSITLCMYGVYQAYLAMGISIILIPIGAFLVWLIGHVMRGLHDDNRRWCGGSCGYRYGNMFSEWIHKRGCLPWLTKKV